MCVHMCVSVYVRVCVCVCVPFEPDTESLTILLYRTKFIGSQTANFLVSVSHLAMEVWDYSYQTFTLVLYPLSHLLTEFYILSVFSHSFWYVFKIHLIDLFICFVFVVLCCIFVVCLFVFEKDLIWPG